MKASRYNIIVERLGIQYWFNSLSRKGFKVGASLGNKLKEALAEASVEKSLPESFLSRLVTSGFVVDDEVNELKIVHGYYDNNTEAKSYMLMILPTLGCNFNCWYCIQDHTASKMTPSTIEAVKRHIDYAVSKWGIKHLGLSWFGGEPLMYFKDVVEPISRYAKEVCEKNGVSFGNNATTNGYFLTKDVAQKLTSLGFGNFQVTIDGDKETHDKVKFQKGCESAFERTLRNLNDALVLNDGVTLTLRINYSKDNLRDGIVAEVNKFLSPEVRNRVRFMARKVWQEPISGDTTRKADKLISDFEESGYVIEPDDFNSGFMACYVCKKFYNAISYNGDVFKCTAIPELNSGPAPGHLNPDGSISWSPFPEEYYRQKSFANPTCDKCVYLPLCMGQCPRNYLQHGFICMEPHRERSFEDSIIRFIDNLPPKSN